ncbi:hypothetical protein SDC9_210673 [bioreactor metagenome]|uniref:Uncharacterized protein n=1 Tax=bioreactor metagenome TaxID=1076179 RepID=A0A645JIH4_9ZZZZ
MQCAPDQFRHLGVADEEPVCFHVFRLSVDQIHNGIDYHHLFVKVIIVFSLTGAYQFKHGIAIQPGNF